MQDHSRRAAVCLVLMLSAAFPASAQQDPDVIGTAAQQLSSLLACQDRLWPGVNLQNIQIGLITRASGDGADGKDARALLWNDRKVPGARPTISEVPVEEFPPVPGGGFVFTQFEDVPTFIVRAPENATPESLVAYAVHEIFHEIAQRRMPQIRRGIHYPERADARYMRYRLIESLFAAFDHPGGDDLGFAVYWLQRLAAEYPADYDLTAAIDWTEGTAEFVGRMAGSLGSLGCSAPPEEILQAARKAVQTSLLTGTPDGIAKDAESYLLGVAAGLLLERGGAEGWKARVRSGRNPVQELLYSVEEVKAPEDAGLRARFTARYDGINEELRSALDTFRSQLADPAFQVIAVPVFFTQGSFRVAQGIVNTDPNSEFDGLSLLRGFSALYLLPGGTLSVEDKDVIQVRVASANGNVVDAAVFPVPKSDVMEGGTSNSAIASNGVAGQSLTLLPEKFTLFGIERTWLIVVSPDLLQEIDPAASEPAPQPQSPTIPQP